MSQHNNTTSKITVLLADDHHIVRSGIRRELERHDDIKVVGEAVDGQSTRAQTLLLCPQLVLLDISMPDGLGSELVAELSALARPANANSWPPLFLILSAYADPEYVFSAFAAGAKGYLLKDELPRRIVQGIREVVSGKPVISLDVQKVFLMNRRRTEDVLTERELEVIKLIAKGFTNDEIAAALVIAIGTVKNHVTNIYGKLPGVRTRAEAVAWAWENNLVS